MKKKDLYYERIPTKFFRENVRYLGNIYGKVIKQQEGEKFFQLVEKVRKLSKANKTTSYINQTNRKVIRSIKPKKAEGGIMNAAPGMPQGMQVDGRNGTFIPMGVQEKADDVPAMLSKNEFVMTADAVRAAGGGSVEKGAQRMYDLMNTLEGKV